jgi:hypothetical protein
VNTVKMAVADDCHQHPWSYFSCVRREGRPLNFHNGRTDRSPRKLENRGERTGNQGKKSCKIGQSQRTDRTAMETLEIQRDGRVWWWGKHPNFSADSVVGSIDGSALLLLRFLFVGEIQRMTSENGPFKKLLNLVTRFFFLSIAKFQFLFSAIFSPTCFFNSLQFALLVFGLHWAAICFCHVFTEQIYTCCLWIAHNCNLFLSSFSVTDLNVLTTICSSCLWIAHNCNLFLSCFSRADVSVLWFVDKIVT